MRYITNLQHKYLKGNAPWWWVVLGVIGLILMVIMPAVSQKLQPIFKPVSAAVQAAYKIAFPDTIEGSMAEVMFWTSLGIALLLLNGL